MVDELTPVEGFGGFKKFDPEGDDYDYVTAIDAGLAPNEEGHWGTVAPASIASRKKFSLPNESYVLLKGRGHVSWEEGVHGEKVRGFKVIKLGDRYFSVPKYWNPK